MTVKREKEGRVEFTLSHGVCNRERKYRTYGSEYFSENYIIIVSAPPRTVEGKNFLCGCISITGRKLMHARRTLYINNFFTGMDLIDFIIKSPYRRFNYAFPLDKCGDYLNINYLSL